MAEKNMVTLVGEKSVTALAERLVKDGTVAKPADMAAFERQLVSVNPHLADIARLPPGTPVVVPKAPVLPPIPAEADPRIHAAMERLRAALSTGQALLARAADAEKAKAAAMSGDAMQKAIADVRARDAKIADSLVALVDTSKQGVTKIDATAATRAKLLGATVARIGGTKA